METNDDDDHSIVKGANTKALRQLWREWIVPKTQAKTERRRARMDRRRIRDDLETSDLRHIPAKIRNTRMKRVRGKALGSKRRCRNSVE